MRAFCINLPWREDRWDAFQAAYPWGVLPDVERFSAIDRKRVQPPSWWKEGAGAWGCYRSHLAIIERCLADGVDSVAIFEDDAIFADDFAERFESTMAAMPADWDQIYLGGNLLKRFRFPPVEISSGIYSVGNVNSTFAYILHRRAMQRVYHHLLRPQWDRKQHIDHHYGQLHEQSDFRVYVPKPWLCGHGAFGSQIGKYGQKENWFNWGPQKVVKEIEPATGRPMVAVLGPFRGGTSCTAGVLHNLGINLGRKFKQPTRANPTGFFEAQQLAQICRQAFKEPWLAQRLTPDQRIPRLRRWAEDRRAEPVRLCGGKHPTLCMMVPDLVTAWGANTRFIAVDRPIEEVRASLTRLGWGWCENSIHNVPPMMVVRRNMELEKLPSDQVLHLDFHELRKSTADQVERICKFLEHEPTTEQRQAAIDFVNPL